MEASQRLLVCATPQTPSDVTMTCYDTQVWSVVSQWKGPSTAAGLSPGCVAHLPTRRSLLGVTEGKPLMHVWSTESGGPLQPESRNVLTGIVSALKCTSDENYCIAAIQTSLYVWLVSTGDLLAVAADLHFQPISALAVSADSQRVVSASHDSRIKVFSLFNIITSTSNPMNRAKELFTLCGHSMPITAVECSPSDHGKQWLFSASLDRSCRVWDLNLGSNLVTFALETHPKCLAIDLSLSSVFIGCSEASVNNILSVTLRPEKSHPPVSMINSSPDRLFKGHTSSITCIKVSVDSSVLFSGSMDKTVRVWLVASRQCLRTFQFQSPVSNIHVFTCAIDRSERKTRERLPNFSRDVITPVKMTTRLIPVKCNTQFEEETFQPVTVNPIQYDESECKKPKCAEKLNSEINQRFSELFQKFSKS